MPEQKRTRRIEHRRKPITRSPEQRVHAINEAAKGFVWYDSERKSEVPQESHLPFRISPEPFALPQELREQLPRYTDAVVSFYNFCDDFFSTCSENDPWFDYVFRNKPERLRQERSRPGRHLFLRPDFILTEGAPMLVELETSPFGFGLSSFLTTAYQKEGCTVMGNPDSIARAFREHCNRIDGRHRPSFAFVLTEHTKRYDGQLRYVSALLAQQGMESHVWNSRDVTADGNTLSADGDRADFLYRGFYLHEMESDPQLRKLVEQMADRTIPPLKAHLEEKALLALVWDPAHEQRLRDAVGHDHFAALRECVPPTWVVDPKRIPDALRGQVQKWPDLAKQSRKQRQYVLKPSGFTTHSSWSRGVQFLHKMSSQKIHESFEHVLASPTTYILQEFREGKRFSQPYYDFADGTLHEMHGKVRFTPYIDTAHRHILTAKATIREHTDYIHASTDSITTAV